MSGEGPVLYQAFKDWERAECCNLAAWQDEEQTASRGADEMRGYEKIWRGNE